MRLGRHISSKTTDGYSKTLAYSLPSHAWTSVRVVDFFLILFFSSAKRRDSEDDRPSTASLHSGGQHATGLHDLRTSV